MDAKSNLLAEENAVAVFTWGLHVAASAVWHTRGSDVEAGIEEHTKPGVASTVNIKLDIILGLYFLPVAFHRILQPKCCMVTVLLGVTIFIHVVQDTSKESDD